MRRIKMTKEGVPRTVSQERTRALAQLAEVLITEADSNACWGSRSHAPVAQSTGDTVGRRLSCERPELPAVVDTARVLDCAKTKQAMFPTNVSILRCGRLPMDTVEAALWPQDLASVKATFAEVGSQ